MCGSNEWQLSMHVTPVLIDWPILFRVFVFWEVEAIGGGMCVCGSHPDLAITIERQSNSP